MDDDAWFPLQELTGRLGGLVWVEEQVAAVLDRWASVESHASTAIWCASTASHHRWHSEIVRSVLPTSPRLEPERAVRAPSPGWEHAIAALGALDDPARTAARHKAMMRAIDPWIERETGALLELARPVSDAPLLRWLGFCALDHDRDGDQLAALLDSLRDDAVRFDDHLLLQDLDLR